MSKAARSNRFTSSLPKNAIVMAKKKSPGINTQSVPQPEQSLDEPLATPNQLKLLSQTVAQCRACELCANRKNAVFGEGSSRARIFFIGEAPGETEDELGQPFVGPAGQLLDKMIEAIGLKREDVYITNVVKCRPSENRDPKPLEIQTCSEYLNQQLKLINPELIVALGSVAAQTLLKSEEKISLLRGKLSSYQGVKLLPTFHPAYLLKSPSSKKQAWEDFKQVASLLNLALPKKVQS